MLINRSTYIGKSGKEREIVVFIYNGLGDPMPNLNEAVSKYVGDKPYLDFIDANLNMPYLRVVVEDVNDMEEYEFSKNIL